MVRGRTETLDLKTEKRRNFNLYFYNEKGRKTDEKEIMHSSVLQSRNDESKILCLCILKTGSIAYGFYLYNFLYYFSLFYGQF